MEQLGRMDQVTSQTSDQYSESSSENHTAITSFPKGGTETCRCGCPNGICLCGAAGASFIYALGRITARFPGLAVEKEYAQATGYPVTVQLIDPQELFTVLSKPENRYLGRQLCWVQSIAGVDTYLLRPRDPGDFNLLWGAVRPPTTDDEKIDLIIGIRGPIAPPEMCNGLMIPIIMFDQVYSFTKSSLINSIPIPEDRKTDEEKQQFRMTARRAFEYIRQIADNSGATDEHRALNYLAVRALSIYTKATSLDQQGFVLTAVEAFPSRLSGVRRLVDVIFTYAQRGTAFMEKWRARVDVTEEFPFLDAPLSLYYDH